MKPIIVGPDIAGAGGAERTASARWALASLALSMVLSSLGTSIANVGLPTLAQAFSASFQQVQWVVLAYLLAVTTLVVSVGRLGDVVGRRRLLLAGIALFTTASLLCGAATTLGLLVAARAVQGLGAAIMMALAMALVGDAVPAARTGSAMGLLGAMSATGTALGPALGGILISTGGWRAMFLVTVPLGILALLLAGRHLPGDGRRPARDRAAFDAVGTVLLALTLAAYALAVTIGRGRFGPLNAMLLMAAGVGVGLFALAERRAASPLIEPALLRDPVLRASLATSALVMTVMMATLVVGPFYLSRALRLDAALVGLVMSTGPVVTALAGVPAGRAVDRLGAPRMVVAGLVAMAAAALGLSAASAALGVAGYVALMMVLTAGYALFQAANHTAVMQDVGPGQRGVLAGMLNLARNLGLVSGASVMGAVFALASATRDVSTAGPDAVAAGMRLTFAVAAALILLALALALGGRARADRPRLAGAARAWLRAIGARATAMRRSEWLVPALLVLLGLVPSAAGAVRLAELAGGAEVTTANARFFAQPLPVVLHILTVVPFALLGALQFAPAFRRRRRGWHRAAGRVLGACGLVAALTGLWMAHYHPWPEGDGELLYLLRLVFGSAMALSIVLSVVAVRRRDFAAHGAWMIRGYAIGMGAGTQALTHAPWFLLVGAPGESSRAVLMGAGWVVNLAVAEWVIRRGAASRPSAVPVAVVG